MADLIPHERVVEVIKGLPGNRTNPHDERQCVYSDWDNPDRHCIAGEVLSRLGLPLPEVGDSLNSVGFDYLVVNMEYPLHDDTVDLLIEAQTIADGPVTGLLSDGRPHPQRWSVVKQELAERGLI